MDAIGQALNSDDRTRSSRQQMCRHLGVGFIARVLDLRTFLQVPCRGQGGRGRANCEMRVVVSPKITRVGVDNSATWFVDGMIHRQRRK